VGRVVPAVATLLLVAVSVACGDDGGAEREALAGIVREPAPDVSAIALPDATAGGEPLVMQADPGDLLVVYFGYTSCPDVCPTTMSDLRSALRELTTDEQARVDVAMVTIDPARDTGELLTAYVRTFVDDAHALRTEDDSQLRRAADAFGADYSVTQSANGEPEVAHSAWVYVVDDQGHMPLQWSFGTPSEDIANDLHVLLDRASTASSTRQTMIEES
jgi:protein SCO1/2